MRARRVRITDTSLRDGHQSLWATRMRINSRWRTGTSASA